ncbi:MAG TPA: protein kinase family protein [Mycobacteriales bacterium]|nr:protein kinase family protein [Mycobacteriales bacterium]
MSVDTRPAGSAGSVGDRYRLLECVAGDPEGPAVAWRAWDDVLNRAVTLTVVRPGGEPASGFLAHAHAVSGVTHPSLARVWDAVDEGDRAYVVSEWVTGTPFTALLRDGALDAESAAGTVARVADGVAAAHSAGIAFGGVHPDHVVVTGNGEVKLAQVVGDGRAAAGDDVRGLGALLYGALTAHWPLAPTGGAATLRPATTSSGHLLSPRQVRAGVPEDLSTLAVRALDQNSPQGVRSAAVIASVLADRSATDDVFSLGVVQERKRRPRWMSLGLPIAAGLVVLALLGWLVGTALGGLPGVDGGGSSAAAGTGGGTTASSAPATSALVAATPGAAKLYDPQGDQNEARGVDDATDGDPTTSWRTARYKRSSAFGGLKSGIGIAYDFGSPTALQQITVITDRPGVRVQIRAGNTTDAAEAETYPVVSPAQTLTASTTFPIAKGTSARYYIVWLTQLTSDGNGQYWGSVSEVTFKR